MHYSTSTALVALAGLAAAGTVPMEARDKKSFSVQQVSTGQKVKPAPALMVMNTYAKFGKAAAAPAPVKSAAAAAASQTGTGVASPEQYDESYLVPVVVGGQTLNLDFDTGSADLWVYSTLQSTSQQSGHSVYNPNDGTSTVKSGYTWSITYGDGSGAGGRVYADKVQVGAVTATSQAVEAATSVSSSFLQDTANDGLLGLAFSSINTVRPTAQTTFFDTVKSTLKSALFTANLIKGAPGSYDFGFIDTSKYTGAITYVPVTTANGFWEFTAGAYSIGSGAKSSATIGDSIADTGTTLFYIPAAAAAAYYKQVSGSQNSNADGGYVFPCSATLPSFTVTIGTGSFVVPGNYLNYAPISAGSSTCFGGIQSNTGIGFSIFGDIFLKSQFVVFDETQSSPRLGFAAKPTVSTTTATSKKGKKVAA